MNGLSIRGLWDSLVGEPKMDARRHCSSDESAYREDRMASLVFWLFDDFVIPIIKVGTAVMQDLRGTLL